MSVRFPALAKQGIKIVYEFGSVTSEVQGVSLKKGEIRIKGSAIDHRKS